MKSVGILIDKFNSIPQLHINMLLNCNNIIMEDSNYNICVYCGETSEYVDKPQFATMEWVDAWGFYGPLISTNILTTQISLECPRVTKRLFYVYNLEWYYNINIMYSKYKEVYQNDKIELIARNQYHANIIENCWKKPKYILDDFESNEFKRIIDEIS